MEPYRAPDFFELAVLSFHFRRSCAASGTSLVFSNDDGEFTWTATAVVAGDLPGGILIYFSHAAQFSGVWGAEKPGVCALGDIFGAAIFGACAASERVA